MNNSYRFLMPVDLLSINTSLRRQRRSVLASLMTLSRFSRASSFQLGIVNVDIERSQLAKPHAYRGLTTDASSCRGRA